MRKLLAFLLFAPFAVVADQNTPVLFCVNGGTQAVPSCMNGEQSFLIGFYESANGDMACEVCGAAVGATSSIYANVGHVPSGVHFVSLSSDIFIDSSVSLGPDANGSPQWRVTYHYSCTHTISDLLSNPYTNVMVAVITMSDGSDPYAGTPLDGIIMAGNSAGSQDVMGGGINSTPPHTITVDCSITGFTATFKNAYVLEDGTFTTTPPELQPANDATNEAPLVNTPASNGGPGGGAGTSTAGPGSGAGTDGGDTGGATNAVTSGTATNDVPIPPIVPPATSSPAASNLVWSANPPAGTGPDPGTAIRDLGKQLANEATTAQNQDNVDSAGIINAINSAKNQAHADAGTLKSALDTGTAQARDDGVIWATAAHNDAQALLAAVSMETNGVHVSLTNSVVVTNNVSFTNYASESTLDVTTNLLTAIQGLLSTNLHFDSPSNAATETTLELVQAAITNGTTALTNALSGLTLNDTNLVFALSSNTAALGVFGNALTNATGAVNGLASDISNLTDITNLDVASETTLQGVSNLLALGLTNGFGHPTNYSTESTLEGVSNLLAGISTNVGNVWSNGLTLDQLTNQASDYQTSLSNSQGSALADMSALTNQASVMGMPDVVGQVSGLGMAIDTSAGGGAGAQAIQIGPGINIMLGANMPSYGPLRQILAWAVILGVFFWNWRETYLRIRDVFTANQATTAGTEVLGTNVNLSSAMLMAVAIFAGATAIPTFAVAVLSNEVSLFISMGNPVSMFSGLGWGYSFLDEYIPLATVVTAAITRVVFTVVIDSIAAVVMGIKLFLVGL